MVLALFTVLVVVPEATPERTLVPVLLCTLDSLVPLLPFEASGEENPEAGMALTLLEESRELLLEEKPLDASGEAVVFSLVAVPGGFVLFGLVVLPEVLPLLEGIFETLPVESPGVFPDTVLPDWLADTSDRSLVVTVFLVVTAVLFFSPETVPADPLETVRDWAGFALVTLEAPALAEVSVLLFPTADMFPDLEDWLRDAVPAATEVRLILAIFSGSPALNPLLTLSGTLLTMVVSTRCLDEKSVALTTVMPLLLLLFMITVVLLITVLLGLLPYPHTLGLQPI